MSSVPLSSRRTAAHVGWQPTVIVEPTTQQGPRWRPGPRDVVAAVVVATAVPAIILGAGAASMARSLDGRVLPGVVVAGTDLSNMTLSEARTHVTAAAERMLDAPLHLGVDGDVVAMTPRALGVQDNGAAVVGLLRADRESLSPLGWVRLRWFGGQAPPAPVLHLVPADPSAVQHLVAETAATLERDAVDASWTYDDEAITFHPHVDGLTVDVAATAAAVGDALAGMLDGPPDPVAPVVPAVVSVTPARVSTGQLGQVLYLDQSTHTLTLYEDGDPLGEWLVATGAPGFPTPTGEYTVAEMRENPTWGNPAPDGWGRDLPLQIGPGPDNPLGVRAINWGGTDHIRFHGTNQEWSLGTDASHGCVRMANGDIVELFDLVQPGTPIISVT